MINFKKIFKDYEGDKAHIDAVLEACDEFTGKGLFQFIEFLQTDLESLDLIYEYIDTLIDDNLFALREWAVEGYPYIEMYIEELGMTKDWHAMIRGGQYYEAQEEIHECIQDMIDYIEDNYRV